MGMPPRNPRVLARNVTVMPQRFGGDKVFTSQSSAGMYRSGQIDLFSFYLITY